MCVCVCGRPAFPLSFWQVKPVEVEKIFDALIRDWAQGSFEGQGLRGSFDAKVFGKLVLFLSSGDDADLQKDEGVVMWWAEL